MLRAHFPLQRGGEQLSRYSINPEEWSLVRLTKQGSHWQISLEEGRLTPLQTEHVRAAAFDRLRSDGFIPDALIDLVEGHREATPVQIVGRKEDGGIRLTVKLLDMTAISADALSASEALSLFLRIMLRELRHSERARKAAPVRTLKLVPQSVIAEIAYDLLEGCAAKKRAPGLILCELVRDLLHLDHHPEAVQNVDAQEKIALVVAQNPAIPTRELHRMFGLDPGSISRLRKKPSFKKAVEHWTWAIRHSREGGRRGK